MTPSGAPLTDRPTSEPAAVGGTSLGNGSGFPAPGGNLGRSATVPPPRNVVDDTSPRAAAQNAPGGGLSRSKTTLAVAPDARDRINPASNPTSPPAGSPGLQRSMTSARAGPGAGGIGMAGPGVVRGLTVRKTGMTSPISPQALPPPPEKASNASGAPRLTEIYDGYMGGFEEGNEPPVPQAPGRVAAWARSNANPANTPSRAPSTRAPSAYGSGTSVSGSLRRRPTRRPTVNRGPSRAAMSAYEEEEEGYVSGEYDEAYELSKIRVKLHYQDDVRGMTMTPDMPFDEFLERVTQKFGKALDGLGMKFKDEDGGKVTLRDDSDFEMAIETARELAKGRAEGKLEIWLQDS